MTSKLNVPLSILNESYSYANGEPQKQNDGYFCFEGVTLLITHYNRSKSLERLLSAFKNLNCRFTTILVSDDGSNEEHSAYLEMLKKEYDFELLTSPRNMGLGHNINKGQDAVKTPYTLYIQEDFVPAKIFPLKLSDAIRIMNERADIDMVRFYAYFKYPHLKPLHHGFSEMVFSPYLTGYRKFYYYSDHPHLRRSTFLQKFGRYKEGLNPERTEYQMMMRFLQKGGKSIFYDHFKNLFVQLNLTTEPSTIYRNFWRTSQYMPIVILRELYRHIRFNINYFMPEQLKPESFKYIFRNIPNGQHDQHPHT